MKLNSYAKHMNSISCWVHRVKIQAQSQYSYLTFIAVHIYMKWRHILQMSFDVMSLSISVTWSSCCHLTYRILGCDTV